MASSAGGAFGVRRPDRSIGGMRRQGPVDRFDEAVGEDERIQEGSFGLDPGMRAADEFQDVASAGYRENAKRVAERGGAEQYSTSVGQEEGEAEADELRNQIGLALAMLGVGGLLGPAGGPFGVPAVRAAQAPWRPHVQRMRSKAPLTNAPEGYGHVISNPGWGVDRLRGLPGQRVGLQSSANYADELARVRAMPGNRPAPSILDGLPPLLVAELVRQARRG